MRRATLVARGLVHHRRSLAAVLLGATCAAAALVGALVVGDSVRGSLRDAARARVGRVEAALTAGERRFGAGLAHRLAAELPGRVVAPAWLLPGLVARPDGTRRANEVSVLGVDERFFALAPGGGRAAPVDGEALLSPALARALDAAPGDELVVRLENPDGLPRDVVVARADDAALAVRVRVAQVLDERDFAGFALASGAGAPRNLFLSLSFLQERLGVEGRANLLLVGEGAGGGPGGPEGPGKDGEDAGARRVAQLDALLRRLWSLEDAGLFLRPARGGRELDLLSERIFLDPPVVAALAGMEPPPLGISTYFVNELRAEGAGATPYSTVAAVGPLGAGAGAGLAALPEWRAVTPAPGRVVVGEWLAQDLGLATGARLELAYWVLGDDRRLREERRAFEVERVVPLADVAADPSLAPELPGLSGEADCRDWDPGVPIDLDRIRERDEAYWDEHGATPKAFLPLALGEELWGNRFGALTAVRVAAEREQELVARLRAALDPAALGLFFHDLSGVVARAGDTPTDFGGLFLGLSSFLVAAALLLSGLLFVLAAERRAPEVGLLVAVGFAPALVRRLLLAEAALLALAGSALGTLLGVGYTRLLLAGLASAWSGAVAGTPVALHVRPQTLVLGGLAAAAIALGALAWSLRGALRLPAVALLRARGGLAARSVAAPPKGRGALAAVGAGAFLAVGAAVLAAVEPGSEAAAGAFFGAGAALLVAALFACRALLARGARAGRPEDLTLAALGRRNAARRPGRSLATIALLASGVFLLVSIAAHRKGPPRDAGERASGTGGFALFATTSLPVLQALDTPAGQEALGLDPAALEGVRVVALRVREGDEASCLELGRPLTPRLLAVDPALLAGRFSFASALEGEAPGWSLLDRVDPEDAREGWSDLPAVGDAASVRWVLQREVGDTLAYRDERGAPFDVRLVGTVEESILQGSLVVAEDAFLRRYPSESGHRAFLIDAPPERAAAVAAALSRALGDQGFAAEPTPERLARFAAVQNAYLAVFQVLGGLGLLLGSAGLGALVLRNVLERRAELALVQAVGFPPAALRRYVTVETALLLAAGLVAGTGAALAAVLPTSTAGGRGLLLGGLAWSLALALLGLVWLLLATSWALRGSLLDALRAD